MKVAIVAKIRQEEELVKSRKRHVLLPKPPITDRLPSMGRSSEMLDPSSSSVTEDRVTAVSGS